MNNTIYEIDLTRMLPPSLKNDEKMIALANVIGAELQKTSKMAKLNTIYARIDELEETVLDILAYDLHVDWYDYSYPIEAKRALIKDSVKVHKRLGTKFAVETALGNLHPTSYVEEWFQYNGEPFSFRVILDTTFSRAGAGYFEIKKAVDSYKRKSAHMDGIIYQCTAKLETKIKTSYQKYRIASCGVLKSGTRPYRNIVGVNYGVELESSSIGRPWRFDYKLCGTLPQKNTTAELRVNKVEISSEGSGYKFEYNLLGIKNVGEIPNENIRGDIENKGISPEIKAFGYKIKYSLCGTKNMRNN